MTPTPGHILLTLATPRVTGRACTHVYTLAHLDTKGCSKVAERTVAGNCTFEKKFEYYSSISFYVTFRFVFFFKYKYFDNIHVKWTYV